jgi:hypothetical protein
LYPVRVVKGVPSTFCVGACHDSVAWRTLTVVIAIAFPLGPEHVRVYDASCAIGPTLCDPLVALPPDQPPDAVHVSTLALLQVNDEFAFFATPGGFADRVTDGDAAVTVTVAVCDAEPPVPVQLNAKLPFAVSAPVLCEPEVAFVPVQPPDAVQLVAFVELQVSVDELPDVMLLGDAVNVTVGAGTTVTLAVCDAEPPVPVQLSV